MSKHCEFVLTSFEYLLTFCSNPKESRIDHQTEVFQVNTEVIWHLTLCTLLSSQGSDALTFHPLGLLCEATSLPYHSQSVCQVGRFALFRSSIVGYIRFARTEPVRPAQ